MSDERDRVEAAEKMRNCPLCGGHGQIYLDSSGKRGGASVECEICKGEGRLSTPVEPKAQVSRATFEKRETGGWFPKAQVESTSITMPQWSEEKLREFAKAEEGFIGAGDTPYNRAVHAVATAQVRSGRVIEDPPAVMKRCGSGLLCVGGCQGDECKRESAEGLPDVYRFRVDAFVNAAGSATVVMHNDATGDCVDYEDYAELQSELQASLLREKEQADEVEMLKETLKNLVTGHQLVEAVYAKVDSQRPYNIFSAQEVKRIYKSLNTAAAAAVTGE